ncbi:MAG TPA: zf-HC2 domain-containing protein [Candidatus Acidoferrales bacterium]|nr:zf-HC2 domain-containing protein [Candidatus Acidoferrales bacterium]
MRTNFMAMMDCKEVLANLSSYVDGEASSELRASLEDHIAKCRRCRVVFDTTQKSLRIVLDVEPFEVPLAVSARLYARLEKELSAS